MDAHTSTTLEALERTAAWVQQVQVQVEMELKKSEEGMQGPESPNQEGNICIIDDDDMKIETNSDKDDNSLTDHHDEALKMAANTFPPYVPKPKNGTNYAHIDVKQTVKEFKEALEKYGISQRFACSHVMENTSQGNLSFLLDKGKNKLWNEISPRGRIPYIRMRRWLDSPEEQKATLDMLHKSKDTRKGLRIGSGDQVLNKREKFTVFQLLVLCRVFEEDQNPSLSTRALLADKLEAPLERITIWFQNQRARGFPAKKLIRESNLAKDSIDINFTELSPKKDQGMKKSNTPLSSGNTRSSSSPTVPLDYSKINATVSSTANELSKSSYNALTSVLNSSAAAGPSTSFAHLPQLPLQLLNMTHQMKGDQNAVMGQTLAQFPGFLPQLYTSQANLSANNVNDALNLLNMFHPITIKEEPKESEDTPPVTTS